MIIIIIQSDYRLPVPNYNTLWGARNWVSMGGSGGEMVWTPSENYTLYVKVDLSLNPLPQLTKFPGSAHGGGGDSFHWNALEQIA